MRIKRFEDKDKERGVPDERPIGAPALPTVGELKLSLNDCPKKNKKTSGNGESDLMGTFIKAVVEYGVPELFKLTGKVINSVGEKLKRNDPRWVMIQIHNLAQRHSGELTLSQIVTELSISGDMVKKVLKFLISKEYCLVKHIEGTKIRLFIFPGLKKKCEMKICEYCGSSFKAAHIGERCPNCQGTMKRVTTIAP